MGKPEGRRHWGDLSVDGWIILGWISRRWDVGIWAGLGWIGLAQVRDACECGNEISCSVKCGEISCLAANQLASQEGLCTME